MIGPGRGAVDTEQDRSGLPFMARAAQGGLEGGRWRGARGDRSGCVRRGTGAGSGTGGSRLRSAGGAGGRAGVEPGKSKPVQGVAFRLDGALDRLGRHVEVVTQAGIRGVRERGDQGGDAVTLQRGGELFERTRCRFEVEESQ